MLMATSWPSKREAAVTILILLTGGVGGGHGVTSLQLNRGGRRGRREKEKRMSFVIARGVSFLVGNVVGG